LKTFFAVLFILLSSGLILAQRNFQQPPAYSPQLTAELRQLQEAAFKSDYAWDQLAHLTNNIGPRPAGSPQATSACILIAPRTLEGVASHRVRALTGVWCNSARARGGRFGGTLIVRFGRPCAGSGYGGLAVAVRAPVRRSGGAGPGASYLAAPGLR